MNTRFRGLQRSAWLCLVLALLVGLQPLAPAAAQEAPPDFQSPPAPGQVTPFQEGTGGTPPPGPGPTTPGLLDTRPAGQSDMSLRPNGLVPAACQEFIQNGDFETNAVWRTNNTTTNAGYIHTVAYSGSSSAYLSTIYLPENSAASFWQSIVIPPQVGTLMLYFAAAAQLDPGEHFYLVFYSANGSVLSRNELTFADNNWTEFAFLIGPQPLVNQTIYLAFEIDTDSPSDQYYSYSYLDAVSLVGCDAPGQVVNVNGVVRQGGSLAAGARISLARYNAAGQIIDAWGTQTDESGSYFFQGLPLLQQGEYYQPWFLNEDADNRLYYWAGQAITSISPGSTVTAYPFDIANLRLGAPANGAETGLATTFSWTPRSGVANDAYYLCFYDPAQANPQSACTPGGSNGASLSASQFQQLGLKYGKAYGWFVEVVDSSHPMGSKFSNAGVSYYASLITFSSSGVNPIPNDDNTNHPQAGWTVMIYFAADNNLSLHKQKYFQDLKQTAGQYPGVNILTLTDFAGAGGTQYCYLSAGAPDCQEWGEQNTADPAVLTKFIQYALARFPASHTMLIIDNHGHSIYGAAQDETSGGAIMSPDKIYGALQAAGLASKKLDILYYNACLMGSLETGVMAKPFASYLVASADTSWGAPLYAAALAPLAGAQKNDPRAAAIRMTNDIAGVIKAQGMFASFAAYDLAQVDAVNSRVSALADALSANLVSARAAIENARNQAQKYDSNSGTNFALTVEDEFVDLRHLAVLLSNSGNQQINSAAAALLTTLGTRQSSPLVIASQQVSGNNSGNTPAHQYTADAIGLSIYFPSDQLSGQEHNGMVNFFFNSPTFDVYKNGTHWDEFLVDFLPPTRSYPSQSAGVLLQAPELQTGGLTFIYLPMVSKK